MKFAYTTLKLPEKDVDKIEAKINDMAKNDWRLHSIVPVASKAMTNVACPTNYFLITFEFFQNT